MLREVKTEYGIVRGIEAADPRITAFKGVPFAAPPVGENRWREPKPAIPWEGVKECYRFAPISIQDTPGLGTDIYCREWHVDPDIEMSEDCLYLNVWTPAKKADEKLPVVVWFFGGGLQWGYTSEMEFDGERVARRGVIVVSINYRLGVFGFMTHPDLFRDQPDAPANFGSLDQRFGLLWVKKNIEAFGGDPENITIAGQSAGGGSVLSQLAYDGNKGLFQKAIIQSGIIRSVGQGPNLSRPQTKEEAFDKSIRFFKDLGVETIEEARKIDPLVIRDKYAEFASFIDLSTRFMPVWDDKFCCGDPYDKLCKNETLDVPILLGNTTNEFSEMTDKYGNINCLEWAMKKAAIDRQNNGSKNPIYYYKFNPEIPGWDNPGTFHSVELWFFFETLAKCWRPFDGRHYDLARKMCNYWCNFIKNGNPNGLDHDGKEMPEWLPYSNESYCDMVFETEGPVPVIKASKDEEELKDLIFGN